MTEVCLCTIFQEKSRLYLTPGPRRTTFMVGIQTVKMNCQLSMLTEFLCLENSCDSWPFAIPLISLILRRLFPLFKPRLTGVSIDTSETRV